MGAAQQGDHRQQKQQRKNNDVVRAVLPDARSHVNAVHSALWHC